MGIKNLKKIFDQYCSAAICARNLDQYAGTTIGIDVSIFLYKFLFNNGDIVDGFTRMILRLTRNNITPVFIFDGRPPKEKDGILQNRRERKDYLNIKKSMIEFTLTNKTDDYDTFLKEMIELIQSEDEDRSVHYRIDHDEIKELFEKNKKDLFQEYEKTSKKIIYVTDEHISSAKKLFDLFGVKYIHEECEADFILATLYKNKKIDGCISEDMDLLANGCELLLRNFNASSQNITEYCLNGILELLQLKYDEFLDMCILCGCDYTTKISGIGYVYAYKNIIKYRSIERILEELPIKANIPDDFNYVRARELFKQTVSPKIMERINKDLHMTMPDINGILAFLSEHSDKTKSETLTIICTQLVNYYLSIEYLTTYNHEKKKDQINSDKTSLLLNIIKTPNKKDIPVSYTETEKDESIHFVNILNKILHKPILDRPDDPDELV